MAHKLADAEVERLCCTPDFIKQEVVDTPNSGNPQSSVNIKGEVPDGELEFVTVKEEPVDCRQEPKSEVDDGCAEAGSGHTEVEDKLMEGSSGVCNLSTDNQRSGGASRWSADLPPVGRSIVEVNPPDKFVPHTFSCDKCDYSTGRRNLMKLHIANKHKIGDILQCELCDYSTAHTSSLKMHLTAIHSVGERFKCEVCDYSSANDRAVKRHQSSKHGKGKLFKCKLCDYCSAERRYVVRHQASKHGKGQLFKCALCDYSSAERRSVRLHQARKHGEGQLFKCELCDYSSAEKRYVERHQASKHV